MGTAFQAFKTAGYPIGYLVILKKICFSNQPKQYPFRSLCPETGQMYNTIQYANKNTTDSLVRFCNTQMVNEACDRIQITTSVQEHGMKILFPLHTTGFYSLQDDEKRDMDTAGEEMIYAILYLENSYKYQFFHLRKCV